MCIYMCVFICIISIFITYLLKKDFMWFIVKGIYNKANTIKSRTNRYVNIKSVPE